MFHIRWRRPRRNRPPAIPFSDIGSKATADCEGDTIGITDADAVFPSRVAPTFSDADWVSPAPSTTVLGVNGTVRAIAVQGTIV